MKLFSCSVSKEPGRKVYSYFTSLHLSLSLHSSFWTTTTGRSLCADCHKFLRRQHGEVIAWSCCGSKQSGFGKWEQCVLLRKQHWGSEVAVLTTDPPLIFPEIRPHASLSIVLLTVWSPKDWTGQCLLEGKCCYGNVRSGQVLNRPCVDVAGKFEMMLTRVYSITWWFKLSVFFAM